MLEYLWWGVYLISLVYVLKKTLFMTKEQKNECCPRWVDVALFVFAITPIINLIMAFVILDTEAWENE